MEPSFPPSVPADALHPDPLEEQARLARLLARHAPPPRPLDGALPPGSFHRPAAGTLSAPQEDARPSSAMKIVFTFAF